MQESELKQKSDASRDPEQAGKWLIKGYNPALSPKPWFDLGEAEMQNEIEEKAEVAPVRFRDGIQDQLFILRPDGTMSRFA